MHFRTLLSALLILALLLSAAWAEGAPSADGLALLQREQYAAAADVFAAAGDTRHLIYCQALDTGARGNRSAAVALLGTLGDFEDAAAWAVYYAALGYEDDLRYEEAAALLSAQPDFRDASQRLAQYPGLIRARDYEAALRQQQAGRQEEALAGFAALGDYKDSAQRVQDLTQALRWDAEAEQSARALTYANALQALAEQRAEEALAGFTALGDYENSADKAQEGQALLEAQKAQEQAALEARQAQDYADAQALYKAGKLGESRKVFLALGDYKDSAQQAQRIAEEITETENAAAYKRAAEREKDDPETAYAGFSQLGNYRDSAARAKALYRPARYAYALRMAEAARYDEAYDAFCELEGYQDSAQKAAALRVGLHASLRRLSGLLIRYQLGNRYGLINLEQNLLTAPLWTDLYISDEAPLLYVRSTEGLWGLVDPQSREILPPVYEEITECLDGLIAARLPNGDWQLLSADGTPVIAQQ